jgi:hypothetical protein
MDVVADTELMVGPVDIDLKGYQQSPGNSKLRFNATYTLALEINVVAFAPSKEVRSTSSEGDQSTIVAKDTADDLAAFDHRHEVPVGRAFGETREEERTLRLIVLRAADITSVGWEILLGQVVRIVIAVVVDRVVEHGVAIRDRAPRRRSIWPWIVVGGLVLVEAWWCAVG